MSQHACWQARRVSRLRARPKGFPVALWKPSVPYAMKILQVWELEVSLLLRLYENTCFFQQPESEGLKPLRLPLVSDGFAGGAGC